LFVGRAIHTINKDGRLSIPAKMRDIIERKYSPEELYLVLLPGNILCLFPDVNFEEFTSRLYNPQGALLPDFMEMERVCADAEYCKLDGSGRIVIPPEMRRRAKIDQEALVIGARSHIEIWDPAYWEWYQEQRRSGMNHIVTWPALPNNNPKIT